MKCNFVREQRHICGKNYMEVDIFNITKRQHQASKRAKKKMASSLTQQNANERYARRHLVQMLATNFTEKDLHITLTYNAAHLPADSTRAETDLENYLRRVAYQCRAQGLPAPAYIAVTEYQNRTEQQKAVRYHHHIVLACRLSRDELENLWSIGRGKYRQRMGTANADRLQFDNDSLEALAQYLTKYPHRKRRWRQSLGLKQPQRPQPNDSRYSRYAVADVVRTGNIYSAAYWYKQYEGFALNSATALYDEHNGWHITVKLRRIAMAQEMRSNKRRTSSQTLGQMSSLQHSRRQEIPTL